MLAALGLLAACNDGRASGSEASDDTTTTSAKPGTRRVTTDRGEIEVPAEPQRVVAAIGSFETDMVPVGVMPVLT